LEALGDSGHAARQATRLLRPVANKRPAKLPAPDRAGLARGIAGRRDGDGRDNLTFGPNYLIVYCVEPNSIAASPFNLTRLIPGSPVGRHHGVAGLRHPSLNPLIYLETHVGY
jgi:hypothetical protein